MQEEAGKLLGKLKAGAVIPAEFAISAHCNRVAVEDGHTESISIKLKKRATPEKIIAAWREYRGFGRGSQAPLRSRKIRSSTMTAPTARSRVWISSVAMA